MSRPKPLSGFPEWLPAQRMIEQHFTDTLRGAYERHGFAPIETRAVEPIDRLTGQGETDKEIYGLHRLADDTRAAELGLHFDLTVPLARYVLENAGRLQFPFRRYQIQKVWRGERPQEGRFREFTQADIDVIGERTLSFHHEVELPLVVADAFAVLPMPRVRMQVNNRKLVEGFYRGLGVADVAAVLRTVDKLDKIGPERVTEALVEAGLATATQATAVLGLASIATKDGSFADRVLALGVRDDGLDEGLHELTQVIETASDHLPGVFVADLRIARGLDYYTGTVYETQLIGHEGLGSICSGGRYDALARVGDLTYPGVGISVGVTRLISVLLGQDLVGISRSVPTCVLIALPADDARRDCDRIAAALRARGIPCEVSPDAAKYGKQIRYAERRGIPYVLFPSGESGGPEARDIRTGEQKPVDPHTWQPPAEDLHPRIFGR